MQNLTHSSQGRRKFSAAARDLRPWLGMSWPACQSANPRQWRPPVSPGTRADYFARLSPGSRAPSWTHGRHPAYAWFGYGIYQSREIYLNPYNYIVTHILKPFTIGFNSYNNQHKIMYYHISTQPVWLIVIDGVRARVRPFKSSRQSQISRREYVYTSMLTHLHSLCGPISIPQHWASRRIASATARAKPALSVVQPTPTLRPAYIHIATCVSGVKLNNTDLGSAPDCRWRRGSRDYLH